MKIFKMSGMQITGPQRFMKYFSPLEYLWQKELAVGFARHQLGYLSAWNKYNSELLYFSVFFPEKTSVKTYTDYLNLSSPRNNLKESEKPLLDIKMEDKETMKLLETVWELAGKTSLEEKKKQQLFCVLSAGCLLAGKGADVLSSLHPQEIEDAFSHKEQKENADAWYTFPAEEIVTIPAKVTPYRIPLIQEKELPENEKICLKKIIAAPFQGNLQHPLVLECYRNEADENPQKISIRPGDYRYGLFVDDIPVQIMDAVAENGPYRMERKGKIFFLYKNDIELAQYPCSAENIVSFAPENNGQGYIVVTEDGQIDYSKYSAYATYSNYLPEQGVIQVQFRDSLCLLLRNNGRVASNTGGNYGSRKLTLDDVEI